MRANRLHRLLYRKRAVNDVAPSVDFQTPPDADRRRRASLCRPSRGVQRSRRFVLTSLPQPILRMPRPEIAPTNRHSPLRSPCMSRHDGKRASDERNLEHVANILFICSGSGRQLGSRTSRVVEREHSPERSSRIVSCWRLRGRLAIDWAALDLKRKVDAVDEFVIAVFSRMSPAVRREVCVSRRL